MELDDKMFEALNRLDELLVSQSLKLEIVICGAFAIQLHGFLRGTRTFDVDTIKKINSKEVLSAIEKIGEEMGLSSRWLNDQASTVNIPEGAFKRAEAINNWKSIDALLIDRGDLIKMKVSAFSIRREETTKDWEDLLLLKPSKEEIEAAIQFLEKTNAPPKGASKEDIENFKETVDDIKNIVK